MSYFETTSSLLYYQCKSCSAYLPSTSKWDRHLGKCLSNRHNSQPGSVGFRLVTFTDARVHLQRIIIADCNNSLSTVTIAEGHQESSGSSLKTVPSLVNDHGTMKAGSEVKRRRRKPRSMLENERRRLGIQVDGDDKLQISSFPGRRKSSVIADQKLHKSWSKVIKKYSKPEDNQKVDTLAADQIIENTPAKRGRGRPPRKGKTTAVLLMESGKRQSQKDHDTKTMIFSKRCRGRPKQDPATTTQAVGRGQRSSKKENTNVTLMKKLIKKGRERPRRIIPIVNCIKRGRGRPKTTAAKSSPQSIRISLENKVNPHKEPGDSGLREEESESKSKNEESTSLEVRKYNFSCDLCPAKFCIKSFLKTHLQIHKGKRKVMPCCVCGRVFNKRDSLNQHYLAHEAAEAREEKFKLLQPWSPDLNKQLNRNSNGKSCGAFQTQQICKFCLQVHFTYHSYITHIHKEHSGSPEAYEFYCKFDNCTEKFESIRATLEHSKTTHPKAFYGRLTWMRMTTGVYTGKQIRAHYVPKFKQAQTLTGPRQPYQTRWRKSVAKSRDKYTKRVKSFTAFQRPLSPEPDDSVEEDWEPQIETTTVLQHIEMRSPNQDVVSPGRDCDPAEKKIKLEIVDLDDVGCKEKMESSNRTETEEFRRSDFTNQETVLITSVQMPPHQLKPDVECMSLPLPPTKQTLHTDVDFIPPPSSKQSSYTDTECPPPTPTILTEYNPPQPTQTVLKECIPSYVPKQQTFQRIVHHPPPSPSKTFNMIVHHPPPPNKDSSELREHRQENKAISSLEVRRHKFTCDQCPAKFCIEREFQTHVSMHNDKGRRIPVACCVCGRLFGKRDSLNRHYLAHETAEAREKKYQLLKAQPRGKDLFKKQKNCETPNNFKAQEVCKFCLLSHYTYHSYITHIREEHSDTPDSYRFPCKFENCDKTFHLIKLLLDHAKADHPKSFYGKRAWERIAKGERQEVATNGSKIAKKGMKNNLPLKHQVGSYIPLGKKTKLENVLNYNDCTEQDKRSLGSSEIMNLESQIHWKQTPELIDITEDDDQNADLNY